MRTVYKHTSPSGKVYIGITGREPKLRWDNGNGYLCKIRDRYTHNITDGGEGNLGYRATTESKDKISKALKGRPSRLKGTKRSNEVRLKIGSMKNKQQRFIEIIE